LSRKSGILVGENHDLVGKISNGCFSISKSSLERRAFGSKSIELSGKVVDGSRELGILVGKVLNLLSEIGNGGFSIGKSGLK
jgi:hypothetical protein